MTGKGQNNRRDDHVRIHAALKTVRESRQSPVGDHAGDANFARLVGENIGASDQVFDSDSVEELDVRELRVEPELSRNKAKRRSSR